MKLFYLFAAILFLNLSTAQNIKTTNKGKVIQKDYNITVPYKDIRGLAVVETVIRGKTYKFLVDTGALSAISQELYEELGLKSDAELDVRDSSSLLQKMKHVTLPPVQLGDITFKDVPAVVSGNNFFFQCLGIDGLIGSNMMRNSVVKFSYNDKTISFTNKLKNFNTDKKKSAKLLKDKFQSNPYLYVDLKNNEGIAHEALMFDSGMVGLYDLSLNNYQSIFQKYNLFSVKHQATGAFSLGIHGVENQTEHYLLFLPVLNFASAEFKNITLTTTNGNNSRIGSEMLKYGDVIIDYTGRRLYFNPYKDEVIDVTEKYWPVQPVIKEDKFVVGMVWDSALNDRVNEGDEIIKFGEIDYSAITPCETLLLNQLPQTDNAIMVLKDVETGEIKKVELVKN